MPIGLDAGGFGGGSRSPGRLSPRELGAVVRPSPRRVSPRELGVLVRPTPGRISPEELGDIVDSSPGRVSPEELAVFVRVEVAPVVPIVWTRWRTAADERVCPECGPLDGAAWPEGAGPAPPLHNHCRCVREFAFVEWATRTSAEF